MVEHERIFAGVEVVDLIALSGEGNIERGVPRRDEAEVVRIRTRPDLVGAAAGGHRGDAAGIAADMDLVSRSTSAPNTFSILLTVKTLTPVEPATCNSSALPAPKSKFVPATWFSTFRLSLTVPPWPLT